MLKYSRSDELNERLPDILTLFRQLFDQRDIAFAFLETVLHYLAQTARQLDKPTLQEKLVQTIPGDIGERILSTLAETWTEQGQLIHARRMLRRQLERLFGQLPEAIDIRIEQADQATLDALIDQVPTAKSLATLFPEEK